MGNGCRITKFRGFGSLFSGKPKTGDPKSHSIRCRNWVLPSTPGTWLGTKIEPAILHEPVKKHLYGGFHKWWYPKSWMVYFMENPTEMDDLGVLISPLQFLRCLSDMPMSGIPAHGRYSNNLLMKWSQHIYIYMCVCAYVYIYISIYIFIFIP